MIKELVTLLCLTVVVCNALYNGETFMYKGSEMRMPKSFNVSFITQYHSPMSLQLNTMCQVSNFQLEQFNNLTKSKYVVSGRRRGTEEACNTVQYCDNGGLANQDSECTGVQTHIVTYECVKSVWDTNQQLLQQAQADILASSANFTQSAVDSAILGLNKTLQDQLSGLNSALTTALTSQEAALVGAIAQSSAIVTQSLEKTISNLATSTSSKVAEVAEKTNQAINSLSGRLASTVSGLANKMVDTDIMLNDRISALVEQLNTVIDSMNSGNMNVRQSLDAISDSLVQLASQQEITNRLTKQGVDISGLLMNWNKILDSGVFQDSSENYYNYVSEGMIGMYDKFQQDLDYPVADDLVGNYAYICYEEDQTPTEYKPPDSGASVHYSCFGSEIVNCTGNNCKYQGRSTYDIVADGYMTNCAPKWGTQSFSNIATIRPRYATARMSLSNSIANSALAADMSGNFYDDESWGFNTNGTFRKPDCPQPYESQYPSLNLREQISENFTAKDGRYVIVSSKTPVSMLDSVTPNLYQYNSRLENLGDVMDRFIIGGEKVVYFSVGAEYRYKDTSKVTIRGNNHFSIIHPIMGKMNIHRCVKMGNNSTRYVTAYPDKVGEQSKAFSLTDERGVILAGTYNNALPGIRNVFSYGGVGLSVDMIVRSLDVLGNLVRDMEPDPYYYTTDLWCCSSVMKPIQTVRNSSDCESLGLSICNSALFGYCTSNSVPPRSELRKLTKVSNTHLCPGGYSQQPTSYVTKYKSPRLYYCSGDYKFASPHGIELQFCTRGAVKLPGAGVLLQSGIMAPGGLYPADCVFWNSVQGKVPIYTINVDLQDQTVPTMITNLRGQKIAYYTSGSIVIDEMDRLYGPQNSGYDCVTYEMDKILHDPRNCINYNMPTYDVSAYFTGKVRTSGISRLLDYFDITPIYVSDKLIMNFALKDGIDYEAAYIKSVNHCPLLNVDYLSNPARCSLSGWPTTAVAGVQIMIGSSEACNGGSCTGNVIVQNNVEINITVVDYSGSTICSRFKCLASSGVFVAYPVETFSASIQRPNVDMFVDSYNDTALVKQINDQVTDVRSSIHAMYTELNSNINRIVINATIGYDVETGDLTPVYKFINDSYGKAIVKLQSDLTDISRNISGNLQETMEVINATLKDQLKNAIDSVNEIIANFTVPIDNVTQIYQNTTLMQNNIASLGVSVNNITNIIATNLTALQNDIDKIKKTPGLNIGGSGPDFSGNDLSGNEFKPSAKIGDPVSTTIATIAFVMGAVSILIHIYNCCCNKKGVSI